MKIKKVLARNFSYRYFSDLKVKRIIQKYCTVCNVYCINKIINCYPNEEFFIVRVSLEIDDTRGRAVLT